MAEQLLRNLDMLAGITGDVVIGERARQQQLMGEHVQRMNVQRLQERRFRNQKDLQTKRLLATTQNLNKKLAQQEQFHTERLAQDRELDLAGMALAKERILQGAQTKKRDQVTKQLRFIDTTIEQLENQVESINRSAKRTISGRVDEVGRAEIAIAKEEIGKLQQQKQSIRERFVTPEMLDIMRESDRRFEEVKLKKLREYDRIRVGPFLGTIGNTTYGISNTATAADNVINPFEDPEIF